ncbi:GMC family oxidoreductase [Caballeronia temeraria]|uniref:GMC family oxidoreductase n=1 Tax=Caballeronia temeraria TaxID=1777137 RepID=UPI00077232BA|nr:GMC oxidoreductase [Caballeronia temeraria]
MQTDYLIVGGGTAGAALAARLSERSDRRVMLLEAGPDTPPDSIPSDIDDTFPSSSLNPQYFWPALEATMAAGQSPRPWPQARVVGGGSSIMGMFALRALPSDYARWSAAGAHGFEDDVVAASYARAVDDIDGGAENGSRDGPRGASPISRLPRTQWPRFMHRIESAAGTLGFPLLDDVNSTSADGYFAMPATSDGNTRSSGARCYLTREVRARPNLLILADTCVTTLRSSGHRVTGVEAIRSGEKITIDAHEVILSAGAIQSPAILMRSGIGPAHALRRLGIEVIADREGVGGNLQNHAYQFFAATLPRMERLATDVRRFAIAGLRASSRVPDCPNGDLMLFLLGRASPRRYGVDIAMFGSALYAPFSRGAVTLASADPNVHPKIEFRMFDDPRDAPRMVMAARLAERLLRDPIVMAGYRDAYLLPAGLAVSQFNRAGLMGAVLAAGAKAVLNGPASLRRGLFAHALPGVVPLSGQNGNAALTDEQLLGSIAPMGHPAGTCAMGGERDRFAVVDDAYRVHGVDGLRVVDASVMPVIPSANTHLPTLMLAEHAAACIGGVSLRSR